MYNVKIKEYLDGVSIHMYKKIIGADYDAYMDENKTDSLKDISNDSSDNSIFNPFTEDNEDIKQWDDMVRVQEVSRRRTIQSIYDIARSNYWDWFVTITFNPEIVDSYEYDDCVKLLSRWLSNSRKKCPDMTYIFVPERHKSGRYHFHGLMNNCDNLKFIKSGKKTKDKLNIYNIGTYNYGFTTATKVKSIEKANKYICKYITKDVWLATIGRKRYWSSRNVARPEVYKEMYTENDKEKMIDTIKDEMKNVKTVNLPYNRIDIYEITKNIEIMIDK